MSLKQAYKTIKWKKIEDGTMCSYFDHNLDAWVAGRKSGNLFLCTDEGTLITRKFGRNDFLVIENA